MLLVVIQSLSHVWLWLFATHGQQHSFQASLSFTMSWSLLKLFDEETYEDEVDPQRFLHTESEGKLRGQNSLKDPMVPQLRPGAIK